MSENPAPRILIVDDDVSVLGLVGLILKKSGFEVVKAPNAQAAMDRLRDEGIDCLITDAIMPGTNGFDFVRALRGDTRWAKLPILMLTKMGKAEDVREGVAAGVTDYVLKPVDQQLLLDKVRLVLKKGEGHRQVFELSVYGPVADGSLSFPIEVSTISESGISIQSPIPIEADLFRISAKIFSSIGIETPLLRLIGSEKRANDNSGSKFIYETKFSFLGMNEADLKKIRSWLQRNAAQRSK